MSRIQANTLFTQRKRNVTGSSLTQSRRVSSLRGGCKGPLVPRTGPSPSFVRVRSITASHKSRKTCSGQESSPFLPSRAIHACVKLVPTDLRLAEQLTEPRSLPHKARCRVLHNAQGAVLEAKGKDLRRETIQCIGTGNTSGLSRCQPRHAIRVGPAPERPRPLVTTVKRYAPSRRRRSTGRRKPHDMCTTNLGPQSILLFGVTQVQVDDRCTCLLSRRLIINPQNLKP